MHIYIYIWRERERERERGEREREYNNCYIYVCIYIPLPPPPYPLPPFSPSLISLVVSVDVKHHVCLLGGKDTFPSTLPPPPPPLPSYPCVTWRQIGKVILCCRAGGSDFELPVDLCHSTVVGLERELLFTDDEVLLNVLRCQLTY